MHTFSFFKNRIKNNGKLKKQKTTNAKNQHKPPRAKTKYAITTTNIIIYCIPRVLRIEYPIF